MKTAQGTRAETAENCQKQGVSSTNGARGVVVSGMSETTRFLKPGRSDEHYTPPCVFDAMGVEFDLDPAQPEQGRAFLSVPARSFFTKAENGLAQDWRGLVWMNPPFGGRNGVVPWLSRFVAHGNGVALVSALTSSGWFHEFAPKMDAMLFPAGKTKFIQPDGSIASSPPMGVVLMAIGARGVEALTNAANAGYGLMVRRAA